MNKSASIKIVPIKPTFQMENGSSNIESFVAKVICEANKESLAKQYEENLHPEPKRKVSLWLDPDVFRAISS